MRINLYKITSEFESFHIPRVIPCHHDSYRQNKSNALYVRAESYNQYLFTNVNNICK